GADYQLGGLVAMAKPLLTDNLSYRTAGHRFASAFVGDEFGPMNPSGVCTGNYWVGQTIVSHWTQITFQGNTCLLGDASQAGLLFFDTVSLTFPSGPWDNNTYIQAGSPVFTFEESNGTTGHGYATFADWQAASGLDVHSTFTTAPPTANMVVVQPSAYETGRANVIVYNWAAAPSVLVDLSDVLQVGAAYTIQDAQNFYGPAVASGTYAGGSVSIPIAATALPTAVGHSAGVPISTGTEFAAFVVRATA